MEIPSKLFSIVFTSSKSRKVVSVELLLLKIFSGCLELALIGVECLSNSLKRFDPINPLAPIIKISADMIFYFLKLNVNDVQTVS